MTSPDSFHHIPILLLFLFTLIIHPLLCYTSNPSISPDPLNISCQSAIILNRTNRAAPGHPRRDNKTSSSNLATIISSNRTLTSDCCDRTVISILGLFERTIDGQRRSEGDWELDAAKLAVRHVNERKLLGSLKLKLIVNDTKVRIIIILIIILFSN
ncbi:hypothetical protein O3M35_008135 [Rhynocoris fuscipes]|uniref:Uncharacterized protein n=1 Tax=Rhynocoris fuscipes TaxID=488301 RepID=A0AAW1D6Q2_9HEMI